MDANTHKAEKHVEKAVAGLVLDNPFFGVLILKMKRVIDNSQPSAWTNGTHIGYNVDFVNGLSLTQLKGLLAHEVMHVAMSHHLRRGHRDPKKWNQAADYVINAILEEAGFLLPEGGLMNPQYKDHTTEHVYNILPDQPKSDGDGDGNGDGQGSNWGEVRDGDFNSEAERRELEDKVQMDTQQAAKAAKIQGNLPSALDRLIEQLTKAQLDWRELLQRYASALAKEDYSWSRPNRRFIGDGIYLPSLHSEGLGPIVLSVDTSGSITDKELAHFGGELNAILENAAPEVVHVIYCDEQVNKVVEFGPDDFPVTLESVGGGGTSFKPPFEYIAKNGIVPDCHIYLTDMYGDFPEEPSYPTIWVTTSDKDDAPFGEVGHLKVGE